jgi:hypothetical protein
MVLQDKSYRRLALGLKGKYKEVTQEGIINTLKERVGLYL